MGKSLAAVFASERWRAPAWLAEAGGALARIVLPAGCRLCEQLLTGGSRLPVCGDCLASFPRIRGSVCRECGVPIDSVFGDEDSDGAGPGELFEDVCLGCRSEKFHFDRARSFARYQGSLVHAMVLLKFAAMELADWFADRLAEEIGENGTAMKADLIVPVPLHKIGRRERGVNRAEMLSKRLAKRLGLPRQGILLVRKRPQPDKHLLTSNERWEAVRGAFATRPGSQVDKQRVLLVDHVMTTGATLDECAKALREVGVSSVLGLTVARAILNWQKVSRQG